MEDIRLDVLYQCLQVAKEALRARVQVLEDCHMQIDEILHCDRLKLITIFREITREDIRSLLPYHFNDAEFLIELIERTMDDLTGNTDHPLNYCRLPKMILKEAAFQIFNPQD
ncbi:hypothetical protein TNCV_3337781 [Trichonephila clavipes]|nr:hypothetical protein TNCV_3337781 [Trichonephila clavipes]